MSYDCPDCVSDICGKLEEYGIVSNSDIELIMVAEKVEQVLSNNKQLKEALRNCMTWMDKSDPDWESADRTFRAFLKRC